MPVPRALHGPVLCAVAVVAAAVSLLVANTPTYDVWAWLVWGREAANLDLDTRHGPQWKPLPVAVAALLSPLGDAAPAAWLVVARAAGLLAFGAAARIAWRAAGPFAAAGAALALATTHLWLGYLLPYGMSEPMLAAFVLWAVDRHVAGRPAQAWWLLLGGALLRPEVGLLMLGYGSWALRRHAVPVAGLLAGLAAVPLAWFGPEWIGSGNPFRLGQGQVAPGGPQEQAFPGLAVLWQIPSELLLWVSLGALAGVVHAVVTREVVLCWLAAAGVAWTGLVAVMAQLGASSGVSRYLVVTHAFAAVLAGVGWVRSIRWAQAGLERVGVRVRVAATVPLLVASGAVSVPSGLAFADEIAPLAREVRYQQSQREALPLAVTAAGGRDVLLACDTPWTDPLQVTNVAWEMRLHLWEVRSWALPGWPRSAYLGPMLQTRNRIGDPVTPEPFRAVEWYERGRATVGGATWVVLSTCPPGPA